MSFQFRSFHRKHEGYGTAVNAAEQDALRWLSITPNIEEVVNVSPVVFIDKDGSYQYSVTVAYVQADDPR